MTEIQHSQSVKWRSAKQSSTKYDGQISWPWSYSCDYSGIYGSWYLATIALSPICRLSDIVILPPTCSSINHHPNHLRQSIRGAGTYPTMAQQKPHPGHTHGGLLLNSLPTTAISLKKQKNMYKVLMPNIKPLIYKFLWAYGYPPGSFGCYRVQWD